MKRRFLLHGTTGILIIAAAEILLLRGNLWVKTFFTPLVWTGYILLVDAIIARAKGESPITTRRSEFFIMLPLSIICWYVFEGTNLLLRNWSYVNLPENTATRWIGYAWSYSTILPGIFLTAELIETLIGERLRNRRPINFGPRTEMIFFLTGFLLFVVTLIFPSRYLCPLPWISVLLWFEGMNDRMGIGSFSEKFRKGDYSLFVSLIVSGAVCGLLWESWNFQAATRWHYHVPYLPDVKLFEMPVLGYLGFLSFAVECYLMYRFVRFLTPVPNRADVLGRGWNQPAAGGTS
ncbi:MAG: hypothetical protein KAX38_00415 [Candidatus Krumholzibacteria bacterium]|nr:hypothetical protein [Candidatus Krumholzibacteria bacterium]